MDGRQKPDAQSVSANDLNDDEILDLTQVVPAGNDDEIIDLTNVLDQPDKVPDALNDATQGNASDSVAGKADDDEIIDLTGMEKTLEVDLSEASLEDDDEIIDLMEAVEPDVSVIETEDMDGTANLEPGTAPTVTDTLETIKAADGSLAEESIPAAGEDEGTPLVDGNDDDDDDIIDLADAMIANSKDEQEEVIDLFDKMEPEIPEAEASQDGPGEDALAPEPPTELSSDASVPLTEQQIETALERTIHKIYAEKIEQLMIQTIEKTVHREIEKIKNALMENDDDMSD